MRTIIALILLVSVLGGVLLWRTQSADLHLHYYSPAKYVKRANALIERGYLEAVCDGQEIRIEERFGIGSEIDKAWYRDSYLEKDRRRFNNDFDRWSWIFFVDEACNLLGVNPSVHAIRLPFADDDRWEGRIFYSGPGSDAVLRSPQRTLALNLPKRPVRTDEQVQTQISSPRDVEGSVILTHYAGGSTQQAARFYYVGNDVVLQNRAEGPESRGQTWLMGYLMPEGRIARLKNSDWLRLRATNPKLIDESLVYMVGDVQPVASRLRLRNGRSQRLVEDDHLGWFPDPLRNAPIPLVEVVGQRLDDALGVFPAERIDLSSRQFDVRLSIDRELHREIDRVFHRWAAEQMKIRRLPEIVAALTVMDGSTGAILSAATFPHPEDTKAGSPAESRTRYRRLLNQNFVRHPIGSAGKPFYFAAIAQAHPQLLSMVIAGHEPERRHREVMHCLLPSGYQLLPGHYDDHIDLETALEISCNKFTVELMTLALAASSDPKTQGPVLIDPRVDWPRGKAGSGIWISSRPLLKAPDLGRFLQRSQELQSDPVHGAARLCGSIDRLEQAPFRESLELITGAETYHGRAPTKPTDDRFYGSYITNRYDLRPLEVAINYLSEHAGGEDFEYPMMAALQSIAPERVNLAFNTITDLRQDLVSLALGGANSTWTNVQLAEAMSRLVTGRAVRAGLIEELRPGLPGGQARSRTTDFPPLELTSSVRERVLEGLRRVISGKQRGTARALAGVVEDQRNRYPTDRIFAFAKTGSPSLLRPVPYRSAEALRALVRERDLAVRGGAVLVRSEVGDFIYHKAAGAEREAFKRALSKALASNGFSSRRTRILMRILDQLHDPRAPLAWPTSADVPESIDGPLYRVGDQLRLHESDPLFTQQLLREQGGVLVLTIVRLPSTVPGHSITVPTVRELAHPDARVLTLVLRVHAKEDSSLAVSATRHLLQSVDLLERVGANRTGRSRVE